MEVLALVLAWKVALPQYVFTLRGNHESRFATQVYGFGQELQAKYGVAPARALYKRLLKARAGSAGSLSAQRHDTDTPMRTQLFACLPLGARCGRTLVCHGGLFRKPAVPGRARMSTAAAAAADEEAPSLPLARLGSLEDLRAAKRGGLDPDGVGVAQVASDVLWSDPAPQAWHGFDACLRNAH